MIFEKQFQNFVIKKTENLKVDKKKLFTSYVSLFLVSAVLVTATMSWFTQKDSATLDTSAIAMNATAGMRVNSGEDLSGQIKLTDNLKLAEASSIDGRNMFFPASESFSDSTANMIFREGNAGDKNQKYYYKNFTLSSDSGDTDVYVKDFEVKVGEYTYSTDLQSSNTQTTVDCPIRIAFILDSSETPIVIDPTASIDNFATTYRAVSRTNGDGEPTISDSTAHSFGKYYYGKNDPIFTIKDGEQLNVTMVAWLEGGNLIKKGENKGAICQNFVGKSVSILINFETNWENMDNIEFVDDTKGDVNTSVRHWINNDNCIVTMSYIDAKTGNSKSIVMVKSPNYDTDYTWRAALPSGVLTNIRFNRYSPTEATVWNAWYTQPGVNSMYTDQKVTDLEETRVKTGSDGKQYRCVRYVATGGNQYQTTEKYRPYPCAGHWDETGWIEIKKSVATNTSDWYLCSNLSGSQEEEKLTASIDADNVYKYTVSLKANSTYTFNFKNIVSFNDTSKTSTTTTYYGGSGTITDTADLQALTKVDSKDKFTLKTTTAGEYTITLDASVEDNYKFSVTKKETVDEGKDCAITVTFLDHTYSYGTKIDNQGYKVVAIFSDGQEIVLSDKRGENFYQKENISIKSGTTLERVEVRQADGTVDKNDKWENLKIKVEGNNTFNCTVNENKSMTVRM